MLIIVFSGPQVLPEPKPVQCRIPDEQFGDSVMLVEFVNCFGSIFDLKASFPKGFDLSKPSNRWFEKLKGAFTFYFIQRLY